MGINRREFMQMLALAGAAGVSLPGCEGNAKGTANAKAPGNLYEVPAFGNVSLLHMTDCHAQLLPIHFREPSVNLGLAGMQGQLPHLVGESLLKATGLRPGTPQAFAYTYLDFSGE